jgi:hypothetical protein
MLALNDWSDIATILSLLGGGSALLKISGYRVGFLRAVTFAFKARVAGVAGLKSVRIAQVAELQGKLKLLCQKGNASYIVVQGPKGVGKTLMIDTCLRNKNGVAEVVVAPNTLQKDIVNDCFDEIIGGASFNLFPRKPNALRVLWWYHFLFRSNPTLVLAVSERPPNAEPAQLTGAVRLLTNMGVNVVVDASPNSLPPDLLTTERQYVLDVEGLSHDEIRSLPQLQNLFQVLDKSKLSPLVLDMLGGIPAKFERLAMCIHDGDVYEVTTSFLLGMVEDALRNCRVMSTENPKFDEIFALLKKDSHVSVNVLKERGLKLPSPCKILRIRRVGDAVRLVPSDHIAEFVFRNGCNDEESLKSIRKLVAAAKDESSA